ncbi:MAG TPA: RNA-binding protein [Verrucomicrobiae bacterium]|nr:RNA-binding protein [Verrucomicrobiae bacterium]
MFSNERPSPYGGQAYFHSNLRQPKLHVAEDTLKIFELQIERKTFVFILKENSRGRFLRIIESGGKNNPSIIVPVTGLRDFQKILADMMQAESEIAAKPLPSH